MLPTRKKAAEPPGPQVRPLPPGAVRWSQRMEPLLDGTTRTTWIPVDDAGREVPEVRSARVLLADVLPWRSIRHRMRHVVRPWLVAGGVAGIGALADSYNVPVWEVAAGGVAATAAVWAVAPTLLVGGDTDPETGRKRRFRLADLAGRAAELVQRRRRLAAYLTATAAGWVVYADAAGLNPGVDGRWAVAAWAAWAALAAVGGKPYWDYVRPRPEVPAALPDVDEPGFGQLIAARWVATVGAVARPARAVPSKVNGEPPTEIPAVAGGKLPGTVLEDVRRVAGGWAATAVDPNSRGLNWLGESGEGQKTVGPRRQVAAVYGAGLAAVTLEPDPEDANRCMVMVQKQSPLRNIIPWEGPDSFDPATGTGHFGRYAEGATVRYELYRPGWGSPHVALFGTTGSGKSEGFQQIMIVGRWAHYLDKQGQPHGMVADFLIDPQHGQSFGPFIDDLAAPVASTPEEAMLVVEAFTREGLRRNAYLAQVEWVDQYGRRRKGRKWWDPTIDGPILALNIDEAHFFLAHKPFTNAVTAAARMWRKCGMIVRIGTHTPLLQDLGGNMALRDMLTGGFVVVYRTANSLTNHAALNGQLPVDPRSIPKVPGMCYVLAGENPRAMLARAAWEPDYYDWVRDTEDGPIGYPAQLPQVTLDTFGLEFTRWRASGQLAVPAERVAREAAVTDLRARDAILDVLLAADGPQDVDTIDRALQPARGQGLKCTVSTLRKALKEIADEGKVDRPRHGLYEVSPVERERLQAERAETGGVR